MPRFPLGWLQMKLPSARSVFEMVAVTLIFSVMGVLFLALMVGWERVPQALGIVAMAVAGFAAIFAFLGAAAGLQYVAETSRWRLLRGLAMLLLGLGLLACAIVLGWGVWSYLTDWMWNMPPCDTPGCRYD